MKHDNQETIINFGDEIKAVDSSLGNVGVVQAYGIRFSDASEKDLVGDYFTADTNYGTHAGDGAAATLNHRIPMIKRDTTARELPVLMKYADRIFKNPVKAVKDEIGILVTHALDLADEYEREFYDLVKSGAFRWSSGTAGHMVDREKDGQLKTWIPLEFAYTPTAAEPRLPKITPLKTYAQLITSLENEPEDAGDASATLAADNDNHKSITNEDTEMTDKTDAAENQAADLNSIIREEVQAVVSAELAEIKTLLTKPVNDPGANVKAAPAVVTDASHWEYDNYDIGDLVTANHLANGARNSRHESRPAKAGLLKAMQMRMESDEVKRNPVYRNAVKSFQSQPRQKADETNFSTNANYGNDWAGVMYSDMLWEGVRNMTVAYNEMVSRGQVIVFPSGAESMVIPTEGTDPLWYLIAQAGDPTGATVRVANTVPAKALGTGSVTMTLGKLGSGTPYTGEMVEDSMLPFVDALRRQIMVSFSEVLDHVLIDGDTDTTNVTNINYIDGQPTTQPYLIFNGFRKSPLITTTANSRDGGVLTSSDYIETIKLLGAAGLGAIDMTAVSFLVDPLTHYKSLELADVKSRDVFQAATIENGRLTNIYGYPVLVAANMCKDSTSRLSNAAGKVDFGTQGNNTKGSILAVRWDRWKMGIRRQLTTEVERVPRSDSWEITSLFRAGLIQSGTEGAAITYNLTV